MASDPGFGLQDLFDLAHVIIGVESRFKYPSDQAGAHLVPGCSHSKSGNPRLLDWVCLLPPAAKLLCLKLAQRPAVRMRVFLAAGRL